jgi:hypothetical protein
MTEQEPTITPDPPAAEPAPAAVDAGQVPMQPGSAPIGSIRGTGMCILLAIVTLGIYTWFWYYKTHDEMKQHTGNGIGGPLALVLAIIIGIVSPFLNSSEVGNMYKRAGQEPPVTGLTGLWILLPIVGAFVWFIKTNGAINAYWTSQGATAS